VLRRGLVICAIAAAASLTAACGGGAGNALQSVASAATKTAATQSAKFHMDLAETVGPVGPLHFTADGVSDNSSHSADMTMDLSSVSAFAGQAGAAAGAWKAHVILDGSGSSPMLYFRLPAIDKYLNGKTWVKADLAATAKQAGSSITQLLQMAGSQDPTKALQLLESVGDVSKVGTETIGGVQTTEYTGTIDVKKVAGVLGGAQAKALDKAKVSSIPIDVWIDGDGLVRRMHEHLTYPAGALNTTTDLTVDLSDFGVKTSIQVPPADQTLDVSALKGIGA
jgi:LppX_LprAFG lipoprotein